VEVQHGTLDDLDALRDAAAASDGVIHLAFKHDLAFTGDFQGAADADRRAVETFGEVLAGSDRPFVIASGTLGVAPGRVATERDGHDPDPALAAAHGSGPATRMATAELVLSLASRGVRSSVMRLPPTNHGDGDNGFMATLVAIARDKGVSAYIGDGSNRWPAVHRLDSAHLFRLAVEKAPAGSTLHAVADEGVPIRDVAEVIGRHLDVPVVSIPAGQAAEHFTWLGGFIGLDAPASSALTRELMGWQPTQPGLIEDLDEGHYFENRSA
jgi:nucleoside-diphosphate-sugar epimerase